jgi:hypothetical protein
MLPDAVTELTKQQPPFASVCLDASRVDPASEDDVALRWEQQAQHLTAAGTPPSTVRALEGAATAPTGLGGEHARVVVASGDQVVLDLVLPGRPARDESVFGPVPHLMPVARALSGAMRYALVRLDRAGADIEVLSPWGTPERREQVEGGHDVLHKVAGGGFAQKRYQARVEDSWAHNAGSVAEELDRIVRVDRPELVLVAGDDNAISELTKHAGAELARRLVRLDSGGRAAGISEEAERAAIEKAVGERREEVRRQLLDEFNEQLSRQQRAVAGLGPVVGALRRGQVERLLLHDDPSSTARLWVGEQPLQVGLSRQDAVDAGAEAPVEVRADAAFVWALVGSDAHITLLAPDEAKIQDGIGAVLRWSDPATEHLDAPSMPGHGQSPGMPEKVE